MTRRRRPVPAMFVDAITGRRRVTQIVCLHLAVTGLVLVDPGRRRVLGVALEGSETSVTAAIARLRARITVRRAPVHDVIGRDAPAAVVEYVPERGIIHVRRTPGVALPKRVVAVVEPDPERIRVLALRIADPVDRQLPDVPDPLPIGIGHDALEVLADDADLVQEVPEPGDFVAKVG